MTRKLTYYAATTLDGQMAAPDGTFDFFEQSPEFLQYLAANWADSLPGPALNAFGITPPGTRWDTVLMGRNTFEVGARVGLTSPYPHLKQYVMSSTLSPNDYPDVEIIDQAPLPFVKRLKQQDGGNIWLCGGGRLAATVAEEVDELVLKVNPVTVSSGIPLFAGDHDVHRWALVDHEILPGDVLLLTYKVRQHAD